MRKKDWYENWFCSAYYNLLYEERDELEAAAFIDALLKHLQPEQGSRMLDIACGEGRFAKKLAERDYNVTGIDLSHASIQNAKQHETDNLHFYVHDMRLPFYFNYFDYAFNFFTSFGYFGKERDHMMAAASFGKSLKKGGILVVDYFNTQYVIDHLVEKETVNKNDHEFQITRNVTDGYIVKDIRFNDGLDTPYHFAERVAAFSLADFTNMFQKTGMDLMATFGDYGLNEYDSKNSQRLIMIFKNNSVQEIIDRLILWDYEAWLYLNTQWVNPVLDAIMPFVRNQWTWAPLYLFLLIFMPMNYKRKGFMWCVFFLLTFALGDFISASIIKPLYLRPRPCNNIHLKDITHLLVPCGSGYSFPSSHATNHFALGIFSAITFKHITKWIWPIGLLWAISVGYAQIYVGVHFPGDVLVGGLLGSIVAIITGSVFNRIYKLERKTATLAPPETS